MLENKLRVWNLLLSSYPWQSPLKKGFIRQDTVGYIELLPELVKNPPHKNPPYLSRNKGGFLTLYALMDWKNWESFRNNSTMKQEWENVGNNSRN